MLLTGTFAHMSRYVMQLFRVRICVCARSYGCGKKREECDVGWWTCSACKIKNKIINNIFSSAGPF